MYPVTNSSGDLIIMKINFVMENRGLVGIICLVEILEGHVYFLA